MELNNEFSVGVPVADAWAALTDLERIAPCMPGFQLQEVEGDEYRGIVKVKVGPMTAQYKGVATFRERDEANHRAVIHAEGRDVRGQGNATAVVTATLTPQDGGTQVSMHTDLTVTGKVAQFGRGVLADVSGKLIGQFAKSLEADLVSAAASAGGTEGAAAAAPPGEATETEKTAGPRAVESVEKEPVDLLSTAGGSVLKRVAPVAVGLLVVFWLLRQC